MNITLISTSPRKQSNSLRFAHFLQHLLLESDHTIRVLNFEDCDIPMLARGQMHKDKLSNFQENLISGIDSADLVVFMLPEYNWTTGGEFINALHQLGMRDFAHIFNNKTFALAGISAGRGGKMPAVEVAMILNKVVSFTENYSIVSPRFYESHETHVNLDENGLSTGNAIYEKSVKAFLDYSLKVAARWQTK